jgi:hypothetical protein
MPKAKRINTTPADPIFVTIANHKRLDRKWLDMAAAVDGAEETGRRSKAYAEAHGITETDVETASDQALAASWKMARTEPTTTAGAAAMLRHLTKDPMYGLWEAFEYGKAVWLETAFRTLERSLAKMARGSRLAA